MGYYNGKKVITNVFVSGNQETENKTITDMDFSEQSVRLYYPTTGKLISMVTIPKPANLAQGNIKKGVTIEGITGTLDFSEEENAIFTNYNSKVW